MVNTLGRLVSFSSIIFVPDTIRFVKISDTGAVLMSGTPSILMHLNDRGGLDNRTKEL
jgi:hypothetical protein